MHRVFALVFTLCLYFSAIAHGNAPELSSDDPIEFDANTQIVTATGNAKLSHPQFELQAQKITFNRETFAAQACDEVILNHSETRVLADSIDYNFNEKSFCASDFRLGSIPLYLEGEHAEGDMSYVWVEKPTLFFGEPDCFGLNAIAAHAEICSDPEGCEATRINARHILFRIGKFPFFYFPYYSHSSREIPISISSEFGVTNQYGTFTRNNVVFDANPNFKWGVLLDYYTKRGVLYGPTYTLRYPHTYSHIDVGYIHDNGNLGKDKRGKPIQMDRYFIEFQHNQKFREEIRVISQVRAWKDSEVLRDFRPSLFCNDQDPESFVEAIYSKDNINMSVFTRFSPNNFQKVQERLPEINFDILPTSIYDLPVYQRFNLNYAHLEEKDSLVPKNDSRSDRIDMFYGLNAPLSPNSIFTFNPVVGGRVTHYISASMDTGAFTRLRGQLGFDFQANAYGLWDCQNKIWKIDGLRHIVRPLAQYRYVPETTFGSGNPPKIERYFSSTNCYVPDLGLNRNRDESFDVHLVRFGVENNLQTRDASGYGSRDLATINVYQEYRLNKTPIGPLWSNLYFCVDLKPAHWINFSLLSRSSPQTWTLHELRTALTLVDGRLWKMTFATDSLHKLTNQYYLYGEWNPTPRTGFLAHWRYDHKLREVTEQGYGFNTRLGNSWALSTEVVYRRGAVRESNWELNLVLRLVPFNTDILPLKL